MAALYPFRIVTHEEVAFEGEIESLIAPGEMGYLGILAYHAPLLTSLKEGNVIITDDQENKREFHVEGGILEVAHGEVTILADKIS